MSPLRVCVLAVTGLALSACGTVSPGAAATVDGQSISMSTLDDTAAVYCEVTVRQAEQQQGVKAIGNGDIRRQAITDLVLARVAKDVADERGLTMPTPSEPDPRQFVDAFGAKRAPAVALTLGEAQDLFNLFAVIGGSDSATAVTPENTDELSTAGRTLVLAAFADHDITFAPRLGLSKTGRPTDSIGSLSVAPTDAGAPRPEELPGPLACRA